MVKLQLVFIGIICLTLSIHAGAKEKRNYLRDHYSRKEVAASLSRDSSWIGYPSYKDRASWERVPQGIRERTISLAETYLNYQWPSVTASMYLEFNKSGDRTVVDNLNNQRANALQSLAIAELMEGKGRFIEQLVNGVYSFCEQTYWGSSAHFYLYGFDGSIAHPKKIIPDNSDQIIDLVVGDRAADLSWIWYFFHSEFDKVSPVISKRLKDEIKRKVLEPYYSRYDFWWITGWGEGRVNNWNPWCNSNILTCIMLIEDDPVKRENGVYKTMESTDLFINAYPEDGGCDEGPGYWGVAGGKLFDYLSLLKRATGGKVDIFSQELIKNMGRYIYRVYVGNADYYINFSDAPFRIRQDASRIYRYGKIIADPALEGFGAYLMKAAAFGTKPTVGRMGETMETLFNSQGWEQVKAGIPLPAHHYFPNLDIAIGRDTEGTNKGFYFAAKGGTNGEGHNHNDVGSFMLYFNGEPVLIDVGVGTYTRETFSDKRYTIWTMQSNYHNLPVINGLGQNQGITFRASAQRFDATSKRVHYTADISKAYVPEVKVDNWIRSYTLERGKKFTISDRFRLKESNGGTSLHFMTTLPCNIKEPGVIEFEGSGFVLQMKYNASLLTADIEAIKMDDQKLISSLGERLFRLKFQYKGASLNGNTLFDISSIPVKNATKR